MNKKYWALGALLAVSAAAVQAQSAAPASNLSISGNIGLFSDYRFRGVSQTDREPALQGGFDIAHSSGVYLGNWNSNVDSAVYNGANLEMDFYGGYRATFGAVGVDVGAIYYYYPGTGKGNTTRIDNTEIYAGASYGPVSAKYYHAVSDFFGVPNTKASRYLDLAFTHDLGNGLGVNAHVGYQRVRNLPAVGRHFSVTDFKVGVTYDLNGYVLGASLIGINRDGAFVGPQTGRDLGKDAVVVSLSKTF